MHIPLQNAVLCLDCEQVSASVGTCVACGSTSIASLSKFVGGSVGGERARILPPPITGIEKETARC